MFRFIICLAVIFSALPQKLHAAQKADSDAELLATLNKEEKERVDALPENGGTYVWARLKGQYALDYLPLDREPAVGSVGHLPRIEVDQVIDDENILCFGSKVWIEGVSTKDLTDVSRKLVVFDGVFLVSGTKRYTTPLGTSRTVLHVVHIDTVTADKVIDTVVESRGYRMWRTAKGDKSLIAKFVRKSGASISLQLPNGKNVKMKLDQFSEEDQEWLRVGRKK